MANYLVNSDNPYLLQHKDNPVDWYPWNEEAFKRAKKENKLIFLSIGYSTCHWCHVMERESFENEEIAKILNQNYVSIKVDREEMPDIDKYYQKVYQLMNRRAGGWPLTIIMTPDKKPFYAATYIPPHYSQFGPGLKEILIAIAKDWKENPKKIIEIADNFDRYFRENENKKLPKEKIDKTILNNIIKQVNEEFDFEYGGTKGAPKFPLESTLDLMIDVYMLSKDKNVKRALDVTLEKMAKGGIFDQVEGGFYRYSTDSRWEVPHFEKMLYNNANLPLVYLRWYKITNDKLFFEVAKRSIDEILNRYRDKNGLFFSASNADSEGIEGKYFVYEYDEVKEAFSEFENIDELMRYFGIEKYGNFNGKNNPTIHGERPKNYEKALVKLKEIRKKREFPFIDTKKITAWNAMMIKALFKISEFDETYKNKAVKTLQTLLDEMYINEKLYHSFNKNKNTKKEGLLEDYAYLTSVLIMAYEYTYEDKYLKLANKLIKETKKFKNDYWYMNEEKTIKADYGDSSYASALSVLANNFLDLSVIEFNLNEAKKIIEDGSYYIKNYPLFYSYLTKAFLKLEFKEYVIKSSKPLFDKNFEYSYILWKKGENFEICTVEKCIGKSTDLKHLLEEIQ